jgi:hypothetical protein
MIDKDEFERTMEIVFDRMETSIERRIDVERENGRLKFDQMDRDREIKKLQADLIAARNDTTAVINERNALRDSNKADLPKLWEFWQTAETLLRICRSPNFPKNNALVDACDKLAKALNNACSACDQIPF